MAFTATPSINVTAGSGTPAPTAGTYIDTDIGLMNTIKSDYIDPRDYSGWDPTGVNPVDSILQSAVNDAIANKLPLRLPKGIYLLNNTVHLATPNSTSGSSLMMYGPTVQPLPSGAPFSLSGNGPSVVFKANFNNAPAFSFTGGKNMHLANFGIVGLNTITQYQMPNDTQANYINTNMRNSQYSPYCGLAIDAFTGATPPDGGYPGLTSLYGATNAASSNAEIRNISISNFTVGIAHSLSAANVTPIADSVNYYRCNVGSCDTAFAVGQGQAKIVTIRYGNWGSCRIAFNGTDYGLQEGIPPQIEGVSLGYLQRVFSFTTAYGPMFLHNAYAESIRSLGNYGNTVQTSTGYCSIRDSEITFYNGLSYNAPLPPITFETFGPAFLENTSFGLNNNNHSQTWNIASTIANPVLLKNVLINNSAVSQVPAFVGMSTSGAVVELDNCLSANVYPHMPFSDHSVAQVANFSVNNRFQGTINSTRYQNGTSEVFYQSPNSSGTLVCTASSIAITTTAITFSGAPASGATNQNLNANWSGQTGFYPVTFSTGDVRNTLLVNGQANALWGTTTTANGGSYGLSATATTAATVGCTGLTFTAADATLFLVGDCLFWKMLTQGGSQYQQTVLGWTVSSIAGSTINCLPLCDATQYDVAANNPTTSVTMAQTQWAPTTSVTCTTATSTSLTSVSPSTLILVGDWVQGSGIAANSRIVSISGSTLTLNKATTASASGVNLYFGRFVTPTTTTTW